MIKTSTYKKYIQELTKIKDSGLSIKEYCKKNSISLGRYYNFISEVRKSKPSDLTKEVLELYSSLTTVVSIDTDDRAEINLVRDTSSGKIQYYTYKIYKKKKLPLQGSFTREEMDSIYRLYSYYGSSLTQRQVSRFFPDLSLVDFKRVLRAFNITKASSPFAPHMIEEKTIEELKEIQLREKENDFLKRIEEDRIKNNEILLKKYIQENLELKQQLTEIQSINIDVNKDFEPIKILKFEDTSNQSINLYLADMHLGATVTSGPLYEENINYGLDEAKHRLKKVLLKTASFGSFDTINIVLLGDNIDCCGKTGYTARLDHLMPQSMDAREQAVSYIELIDWFIHNLISFNITSNINIYSVPNGNHSGDFEYICNKAIMNLINAKYPDISTTLWDKFYGWFELNNHVFVCTHGKDSSYMSKPLPLILNEKTQVMIYEFINENNIKSSNPIHIIKGDLHSNSLTSCKLFDYRNVLSLFGASDYSSYNYSRNSWGVSYDMFLGDNLVRGTFENI